MQVGKNKKIVFILPFVEMVSNYVRALCIEGYDNDGWEFLFLKGTYPRFFNVLILRSIYRIFYYLNQLKKIKKKSNYVVAYIIKPSSPVLVLLIKHIIKIKVIVFLCLFFLIN